MSKLVSPVVTGRIKWYWVVTIQVGWWEPLRLNIYYYCYETRAFFSRIWIWNLVWRGSLVLIYISKIRTPLNYKAKKCPISWPNTIPRVQSPEPTKSKWRFMEATVSFHIRWLRYRLYGPVVSVYEESSAIEINCSTRIFSLALLPNLQQKFLTVYITPFCQVLWIRHNYAWSTHKLKHTQYCFFSLNKGRSILLELSNFIWINKVICTFLSTFYDIPLSLYYSLWPENLKNASKRPLRSNAQSRISRISNCRREVWNT